MEPNAPKWDSGWALNNVPSLIHPNSPLLGPVPEKGIHLDWLSEGQRCMAAITPSRMLSSFGHVTNSVKGFKYPFLFSYRLDS